MPIVRPQRRNVETGSKHLCVQMLERLGNLFEALGLHGSHNHADNEPRDTHCPGHRLEAGEHIRQNRDADPGADQVPHDIAEGLALLFLNEEEPEDGKVQQDEREPARRSSPAWPTCRPYRGWTGTESANNTHEDGTHPRGLVLGMDLAEDACRITPSRPMENSRREEASWAFMMLAMPMATMLMTSMIFMKTGAAHQLAAVEEPDVGIGLGHEAQSGWMSGPCRSERRSTTMMMPQGDQDAAADVLLGLVGFPRPAWTCRRSPGSSALPARCRRR